MAIRALKQWEIEIERQNAINRRLRCGEEAIAALKWIERHIPDGREIVIRAFRESIDKE
jgi:hypothetical protein